MKPKSFSQKNLLFENEYLDLYNCNMGMSGKERIKEPYQSYGFFTEIGGKMEKISDIDVNRIIKLL